MNINRFHRTVKMLLFPVCCLALAANVCAVEIFELDFEKEKREEAKKKEVDQAYRKALELSRKKLAEVDKVVDAAKAMFAKGKYQDAIDEIKKAQRVLDTMEGQMPARKKKKVVRVEKNMRHEWARLLMEKARRQCLDGRYDKAIGYASEATSVDPSKTDDIGKFIDYCQRKIKSNIFVKDTKLSTVDRDFNKRKKDIHILLQEAKILYKNQRYAEVRNKLEQIFIKDNFNQEALSLLNKTYNKLYKAGHARAKADQEEQIGYNDWSWIEPVMPTEMGRDIKGSAEDKVATGSDLYDKMQNIIFPKVEFEDVDINSVIRQLNRMSKRYDPDKQGVSIVSGLSKGLADMTPKITMSFDNMPMSEVIRYICQGSGLKYRIADNAVIMGLGADIDEMKTRFFKVRSAMITSIAPSAGGGGGGGDAMAGGGGGGGGDKVDFTEKDADIFETDSTFTKSDGDIPSTKSNATSQALKAYFLERGIDFPPNSAIAYNRKAGKLLVRNTRENLRKMEDLLRQLDIETPMVMVEVKFIELTDDDTKELGFDWYFSAYDGADPNNADWTISGGGNADSSGNQTTTLLRHYASNSNNSQEAGNRNYKLVNDLKIFPNFGEGLFGDNTVNLSLTVNALDQNDKVETISAPRVIATSGTPAMIKMVTETYFPDSWEEPEVTVNGNTVDVKTPVPEFGDATDIGIRMMVTPEVSPNNYTISLHLTPQVVGFSGWDYYPYTIKVGSIQTVSDTTTANDTSTSSSVKMPRISRRDMDVRIKLYDGETVLIGGMVRTTNSNSSDRWPVLGSVPFFGRFFSREFSQTLRTNLLIFVTCRLINSDGVPVRSKNRGVAEFNR